MTVTTNYLDLYNEEQFKEVFFHLADNGDWEYVRLGFGEDHVGLYIVDLNDSGEQLREKFYVKKEFSVGDVLAEGVAFNVFEKYENGDPRGTHGFRVDGGAADNWDFLNKVLA